MIRLIATDMDGTFLDSQKKFASSIPKRSNSSVRAFWKATDSSERNCEISRKEICF